MADLACYHVVHIKIILTTQRLKSKTQLKGLVKFCALVYYTNRRTFLGKASSSTIPGLSAVLSYCSGPRQIFVYCVIRIWGLRTRARAMNTLHLPHTCNHLLWAVNGFIQLNILLNHPVHLHGLHFAILELCLHSHFQVLICLWQHLRRRQLQY